jgi:hypothetical protein
MGLMDDTNLERFKADLRPLLAEYDAVAAELKVIDEALMVDAEANGALWESRYGLERALEAASTAIIERVGLWLMEG